MLLVIVELHKVKLLSHKGVLKQEITAYEKHRNELFCEVDWQFPTEDPRIKLKRLYPSISS